MYNRHTPFAENLEKYRARTYEVEEELKYTKKLLVEVLNKVETDWSMPYNPFTGEASGIDSFGTRVLSWWNAYKNNMNAVNNNKKTSGVYIRQQTQYSFVCEDTEDVVALGNDIGYLTDEPTVKRPVSIEVLKRERRQAALDKLTAADKKILGLHD